jgi:hypothetical protein
LRLPHPTDSHVKIAKTRKASSALPMRCTDGSPPQAAIQTLTLLDFGLLVRRKSAVSKKDWLDAMP